MASAAPREGLSEQELRDALATYVRTILSGDSRYDRYLAGDSSALTPVEQAGLRPGDEVRRQQQNTVRALLLGPRQTGTRLGGAARAGGFTEHGRYPFVPAKAGTKGKNPLAPQLWPWIPV